MLVKLLVWFGLMLMVVPGAATQTTTPVRAYFFVASDCPRCGDYLTRFRSTIHQLNDWQVPVSVVFAHADEDKQAAQDYARKIGVTDYVLDEANAVSREFGISRVPTLLLVDIRGNILYRGSLDDSADQRFATTNYFLNAIKEHRAGKPITVSTTSVDGCLVRVKHEDILISETIYKKKIRPLMEAACLRCHTKDGVGPMSLESIEDVSRWRSMIADVLERYKMPPSNIGTNLSMRYPPQMTNEQRSALVRLISGEDVPEPLQLPQLPQPNAFGSYRTVELTKSISVDLSQRFQTYAIPVGVADWQNLVMGLKVGTQSPKELRSVRLIALEQGDALLRQMTPGQALLISDAERNRLDAAARIATWEPGSPFTGIPKGYGVETPANSYWILLLRYRANFSSSTDRPRIQILLRQRGTVDALEPRTVRGFQMDPSGLTARAFWEPDSDEKVLGMSLRSHGLTRRFALLAQPRGSMISQTLIEATHNWQDWPGILWLDEPIKTNEFQRLILDAGFQDVSNHGLGSRPAIPVALGTDADKEPLSLNIWVLKVSKNPLIP